MACSQSFCLLASVEAGPIPPGRQYRLTIEGENNVTFVPQLNLPPSRISYEAKIEYIVDTRFGKEPRPVAETDDEEVAVEKPVVKAKTTTGRAKTKKAENPALKVNGAVDLSLHSSEMTLRQGGQAVVETRITRSKFQGAAPARRTHHERHRVRRSPSPARDPQDLRHDHRHPVHQ